MSSIIWPHVMSLLSIDRIKRTALSSSPPSSSSFYPMLSHHVSYPIIFPILSYHVTQPPSHRPEKISFSVTCHLRQLRCTELSRIAFSESNSHVIQLLWLLLTSIDPFQLISIWFLFLAPHPSTPSFQIDEVASKFCFLSVKIWEKNCAYYTNRTL